MAKMAIASFAACLLLPVAANADVVAPQVVTPNVVTPQVVTPSPTQASPRSAAPTAPKPAAASPQASTGTQAPAPTSVPASKPASPRAQGSQGPVAGSGPQPGAEPRRAALPPLDRERANILLVERLLVTLWELEGRENDLVRDFIDAYWGPGSSADPAFAPIPESGPSGPSGPSDPGEFHPETPDRTAVPEFDDPVAAGPDPVGDLLGWVAGMAGKLFRPDDPVKLAS